MKTKTKKLSPAEGRAAVERAWFYMLVLAKQGEVTVIDAADLQRVRAGVNLIGDLLREAKELDQLVEKFYAEEARQ